MALRDPPSPFGTSLIDLLVGALAIVALLWVFHVRYSGERGTGDHERTSGFAVVEQYGIPHIKTIRLEMDGVMECGFDVNLGKRRPGDQPLSPPASPCTMLHGDPVPVLSSDRAGPEPNTIVERHDGNQLTVTLSKIKGQVYDPPFVVVLQAEPFAEGFRAGVRISVQDLGEHALTANLGIDPCCSLVEPHYLRVMTLSGSGKTEQKMFWHEAGLLQHVLACNRGSPVDRVLCTVTPNMKRSAHSKWAENFKSGMETGTIQVSRSVFQLNGPSGEGYYSLSDVRRPVHKCVNERKAIDSRLRIRFDPDGDVTLSQLNAAGPPTGAGTAKEAGYATFIRAYDRLLEAYSTAP